MSEINLEENTIIVGEHQYIAALDIVIAQAKQQLLIFDQDLSSGDFSSIKRYQLIHDFLTKDSTSRLIIVLHDTTRFITQCPRLFNLLVTFGHKMTVYETNDHAKIAKDCFILADECSYIRRFHIDQSRFKYMLNDKETTASLRNRFDELLQETTHPVSATNLGL
ncbi:MAG: hypothetical protein ACMZ63_10340 [Methylotenera sp.]|jgi:hypothetical protein